ncbi:uncharacterized protein STEHIDRAFT_156264 [Stereum hirsutum FP-91666 SS1]|uniref:uncharacterized protein n=1 Tax=Stereum hirsutum (strain FP-91666) TaxID=721885 RepID=UPI000440E63C|nr:uncharacterized protein STEHIDRAFT_156264 [Stereum hirsutum FP-91666 SS1]EIM87280.1 hypothetical protein STEHIDRAFT_156264 [Stereum hirsutum FP-91666 SS1]
MAPSLPPVFMRILIVSCGALLLSSTAIATALDPCAKIAGLTFVATADAIACQKSFPLNETLRQNVLSNIARVFDFYTFEDYYLDSPPPFQESTTNIRAQIARMNATHYETDYDFNSDVYNFTTQLNDGHTRWFPNCYNSFQNILPAPPVILEVNGTQNVFIAPDSVEFLSQLGSNFTDFFDSLGFNWQRLAGAKVLEIGGMDAFDYIDLIAKNVSGNYLDHGVRVNSVISSYRIQGTDFSQRLGDLAGPELLTLTELTFKLILKNGTEPETVTVPYVADFIGVPFMDQASFWANNCAANNATNGIDLNAQGLSHATTQSPLRARGALFANTRSNAIGLPQPFLPNLPPVNGSEDVIKSFVLDNTTGVMFVGSFEPTDFDQFQFDVQAAVENFQAANVTRLLIDLTNNGGGFVCLGLFLHQFLAGLDSGYPGFECTVRANTLAQKIVAADIALNDSSTGVFYAPPNWAFLNDTQFSLNENFETPDIQFIVNGQDQPTSQRFHDICTPYAVPIPATPPFDLKNVAMVNNGNCASTCSLFSTVMHEKHGTKIAVFGGKPGEDVQFKGMAGNQVLEWADLDTEIKTAQLKDDPLAPPDLIVSANMRHNWRTAYSFLDEHTPIGKFSRRVVDLLTTDTSPLSTAYVSELPTLRFPYTMDTYNNPQNLWKFAASQLFD